MVVCCMITSSFCLRFIVSSPYCTHNSEFCCKCRTLLHLLAVQIVLGIWQTGPSCSWILCSQITDRRWPPLFTKVAGKRRWQAQVVHNHKRVSQRICSNMIWWSLRQGFLMWCTTSMCALAPSFWDCQSAHATEPQHWLQITTTQAMQHCQRGERYLTEKHRRRP